MRIAYSFSVLRYVHDPVTQEFVNIGIAVLAPEAKYLRAVCTSRYSRITGMFEKIDGDRFRQITRHIHDQICAVGREYESALPFEAGQTIERMLAKVLPQDDSAIQFSKAGVGLSADLDKTVHELYQRYVERYAVLADEDRRTDDEVWSVFREPLDRAHVTPRLKPKLIVARDYQLEFKHAWKNERWHLYEPVSFDLVGGTSILDKANRWLGRATSLMDGSEPFELHLLLGEPQDEKDERLKAAFTKAQNILNKIPAPMELIRESKAEAFAEALAKALQAHPKDE